MKFVFLFGLLITLSTEAQTREELINEVNQLYHAGEFEKAVPVAKKAIDAAKKEVGPEHLEYAVALNDLATIYFELGEFEKAEPLLLSIATIRKNRLGENDPLYAKSLKDLANNYHWMSDFIRSADYYIQAGNILKKLAGELSEEYANNLYDLGLVYYNGGFYEKAEPVALNLKTLREELFGPDHTEYATSVSLLGMIYMAIGQFDKAESHFLEASFIEKKEGTENSYATARGNLANLYQTIGHFKKAEPILEEVIEIKKRRLGTDNAEYALALANLSVLYTEMEEYDKAEALAKESIAIRRKLLTDSDPNFWMSMHNLASLYTFQEKFVEAEKILVETITARKKLLGENHPDYLNSIGNLASLYFQTKRYREAEPLLLKCAETWKKQLGEKHPDYAASLNNLALLHSTRAEFEKAEGLMMKSNRITKENIARTFILLAEKEKEQFLANRITVLDDNNSMLFNHKNASQNFRAHSYEQLLFFKSLLLSDSRNMLKMVQLTGDSTMKSRFERWTLLRKKLAEEYSLPAVERSKSVAKMESDAEFLEKLLMYQSASFRRQQTVFTQRVSDIQKSLEPGEAAIEFVRFDLFNKGWTDSTIYAAYILGRHDSIPVFVPLCDEARLQKIFDSAGSSSTDMVSKFYRGLEGKNKSNAGTLGTELYKLVWAPLEPYLKGVKSINYSPAGKLYNIAFHALPVDSNTLLMDKFDLRQYTNTRDLVLKQNAAVIKPTLVTLLGDPLFSLDSMALAQKRKDKHAGVSTTIGPAITRANSDTLWGELPGTAEEIRKLQQLFETNKIGVNSFTRQYASEEQVKSLSGNSPQVLHIASHGFFLPEPGDTKKEKNLTPENAYVLSKDPLLRSGLVLAGGNYAWSGKTPVSGVEDGILTAYEISQLDLSKTELVVLSACETALGDIKGSEGVFGLQRAFKMAGVKKMIVSLWQVPDKETAELMTAFYEYCIKGKTIADAFNQAQSQMRKKYPAFYWAAFVLVE